MTGVNIWGRKGGTDQGLLGSWKHLHLGRASVFEACGREPDACWAWLLLPGAQTCSLGTGHWALGPV